jgi:hypothetical protein
MRFYGDDVRNLQIIFFNKLVAQSNKINIQQILAEKGRYLKMLKPSEKEVLKGVIEKEGLT